MFFPDAFSQLCQWPKRAFSVNPGCRGKKCYTMQWLWWKYVFQARRQICLEQSRYGTAVVIQLVICWKRLQAQTVLILLSSSEKDAQCFFFLFRKQLSCILATIVVARCCYVNVAFMPKKKKSNVLFTNNELYQHRTCWL